MSQAVYQALERVVDQWVGLEAGTYGTGSSLQDMWTDAHPVSPDYDPHGILNLIGHIHGEPIFQACPKAMGLDRGYFVEGGGIQTFGNLYDYVEEC